jgi:endogenous inhibitor of DNA gyrase (YacG/DUF329 family)
MTGCIVDFGGNGKDVPDRKKSKTRAPKVSSKAGTASAPCPICGSAPADRFRPFCSSRCADLDLGRWLKGRYRVPTSEAPRDGGNSDEEQD